MCDHVEFLYNCKIICSSCGKFLRVVMDPSEMTYNSLQSRQSIPTYARKDRFYRLFCNLRGWQSISNDDMTKISRLGPFKTVKSLRKTLRMHFKHHLNKLPTVWRFLGNKFDPPSARDFKMAMHAFINIMEKKVL